MSHIESSIEIDASPRTVWRVLTDLDGYARWNTLCRVDGTLEAGEALRARLRVPGLPVLTTEPTVTVCSFPNLAWVTTLPGVRADHRFHVDAVGEHTRFVQCETFEGPLASLLVSRLGRNVERGFEMLNRGLKRHAESM